MIFLKAFKLWDKTVSNNNIYPFSVLQNKAGNSFIFDRITIFYGSNGCGKSTILNLIAHRLDIEGKERDSASIAGYEPWLERYAQSCGITLGEDERGRSCSIPSASKYFKSEEILYEVRKIQQDTVLRESMNTKNISPQDFSRIFENIQFSQNKFSNGETTMQFLEERIVPDALYLLDEPEVSLSAQNQLELAQSINHAARLLNNQFIISTHSPFLLGSLNAKIYDIDTAGFEVKNWTELENVRHFYEFFKAREKEFDQKQQ